MNIEINSIISDYKSGKTINQIAREYHVANHVISDIIRPLNLPTNKIIVKILNYSGFREFFLGLFHTYDSLAPIREECLRHPFFERISKKSIDKRIGEIRNFFNIPPIMPETVYSNEYDRIRGYIIRNSKYMAKRRNIPFNLKYTDFELPEFCPILGIKLEYGSGNNGNAPQHATLDRIDNSKGYIPGNVMIISRLANAMKNSATFEQLTKFIESYSLLINYINNQGALGDITDIFPNWRKLSLDP